MKNKILPFALFFIAISGYLTTFGQGCEGIITIDCGNPVAFNPGAGIGSSDYPNGLGTGCYSNSGLGGLERIFEFIAPDDGTYQIQTLTTNNGIVEYFYKSGNQDPCLGSGWTCLGYTSQAIQLDAINLLANESIWIIANAESNSVAPNQNFQINCVVPFACTEITEITCGTTINFNVGLGYGDPLFSNGLGSSCYNNSGQGGLETIYHFEASESGTFNISTVSASSSIVEYFYKVDTGDPCSATGWSCLGYTSGTNILLDGINLNAGDGIYILANSESHNVAASASFQISCANPFACSSIQTVECGEPITFNTEVGYGDPLFYNGLGSSCYSNSGQGGEEAIYEFTATATGTYLFEVISASNSPTVEYFYQLSTADPCSASGWICLGYRSSIGLLDAINLNEGDVIRILANSESATFAASQTFQIRCAVPFACTEITSITCGVPINFVSDPVLGNPDFYNGLGSSCYNNTGQGGQEAIFQFTPPSDGTYQFRTVEVTSGIVEYFYKSSTLDPCSPTGWICLGYTSSITNLDAINLLAGESIWLLVNTETTNFATNQTFVIDCAVPFACSTVENITCGQGVVFNPGAGLGNPDYYNGLGTSCYNNSGQGGREKIYSFTAPESGTYLIETLNVFQPTFVEYLYKSSTLDPCVNTGWICLGYTGNTSYLDAINLNEGESIWIIVNAESALGAGQLFQVRCAHPFACDAMEQITCGSVITYQSAGGHGNPSFNNGLGTSCYSSSGQGGTEKIYQFVAPESGTFAFSVTNVPAGGVFEYFTKDGAQDPCSANGWQCLNYRSTPGSLGTRTLTEGQLIYILVNTESLVPYAQSWQVSCVTSTPININVSQTNVLCFGGSTGALNLTITGGTGPYTFDWTDIAGSNNPEDRTGLSAGQYAVTVTDAIGTEATQQFTITQAAALQIFETVITPSAPGENDGSISLILVGATGPFNTDWDDMLGTNNPEDRTNLEEGQYCLNITDANMCVTNTCLDVFIENQNPLTVEAIVNNPLCHNDPNGSIELIITGGSPGYNIDWTDLVGDNNQLVRNNLESGEYEVTVTDDDGAITTQSFILTNPSKLITNGIVQGADGVCANGSISISITGGIAPYSIQWQNIDSQELELTDLLPGEYCVDVTDANSCLTSTCFQVESNILELEYQIQVEDASCSDGEDGSILIELLNGCEPITFDWFHIPGIENSNFIDGLAAGSYTVQVTDGNNLIVIIPVQVNAPAALTINAIIEDASDINTPDGSITLTVTGSEAPLTFDWNDIAGVNNTINRVNLSSGEYCVEVTDINGCSVSDCFNVGVDGVSNIDVDFNITNTSCNGSQDGVIELTISGGIPDYQIDWADLEDEPNLTVRENLASGNYEVTISDQTGQNTTLQITITQPEALDIQFDWQNPTSQIAANGWISNIITGGTPPYQFDWEHLAGDDDEQNLQNLDAGEYCLTVTDANGCTQSGCIVLVVTLFVEHNHGDVSCSGGNDGFITLNVIGGSGTISFDWADLPGSSDPEDRFGLSAGIYNVVVSDEIGNQYELIIEIDEPSPIEIFSVVTPASPPDGSDGSILLNIVGGTPDYQTDWADLPGQSNAEDRFDLAPGQYCITITDANECQLIACYDVEFYIGILENTENNWLVYPNPFQDEFNLQGGDGRSWDTIDIYDSTGRLVFTSSTKQNTFTIDVAPGHYHLRIGEDGQYHHLSLIKN